MSLCILKDMAQVEAARRSLEERGISSLTPPWKRWLQNRGLLPGRPVGDRIKSWDLELTIELVERNVPPSEPVLDLGAIGSETLPALSRLGYTDLVGIDLNPDVTRNPDLPGTRWVAGDFTKAPFPDASFAAVTAVSVIEHGYDGERLFAEAARLLRPGGIFAASFDYWPEKIDTSSILLFGLSWRIFSEAEARAMLESAARHGLHPQGALDWTFGGAPVDCLGRRYTFAWTALRKKG